MQLTFGDAKRELKRYAGAAGKCIDDPGLDLFVKSVIQELLENGAYGNLRKWEFITQNGLFTAPPDLELPVSVLIEDGHRSRPGMVYDKWYEFYDQATLANCRPWEEGIVEEPNTFYTAFDPPPGTRLLAIPTCWEADDSHFLINGTDPQQEDIYMPDDGEVKKGEKLRIRKVRPLYTLGKYQSITSLFKTPTKGYVALWWYDPVSKQKGFLGKYRPNETAPTFRRFRVVKWDRHENNRCFKVTLLGRIRFFDNYSDWDVIPITNLRALKLIAQQFQAEDNDNVQIADYKNKRALATIENQNQYQRTPQASINFNSATSPGKIPNLI